MVCEHCNYGMVGILAEDDPDRQYAFNLYFCARCMTMCKENVWNNPGKLWIYCDNSTRLYEE